MWLSFSMSFYAQSVKDLQYYKKINSLKQNDGYLSKLTLHLPVHVNVCVKVLKMETSSIDESIIFITVLTATIETKKKN